MNHPIHPMLVHFPIALLFASVLFDFASFLTGWEDFKRAGFWLLILGWVGGLAATVAGLLGEEIAKKAGVPESMIDRHELFAISTLALFALLIVVRIFFRKSWPRRGRLFYMGAALIGLSLLSATGYLGGDLVYRYGAGVQSKAAGAPLNQAKAGQEGPAFSPAGGVDAGSRPAGR